MSILPDSPAPAESRRVTYCTPLLDLLRTTAAERGSVTFKVLSSDHEDADRGCVGHDGVIYLPAPDRDRCRAELVLVMGLYLLGADERDGEAGEEFAERAARNTLTLMARAGRAAVWA